MASFRADEHIDTKLAGLLLRSTPKSLYGKFTPLTGETSPLLPRQKASIVRLNYTSLSDTLAIAGQVY